MTIRSTPTMAPGATRPTSLPVRRARRHACSLVLLGAVALPGVPAAAAPKAPTSSSATDPAQITHRCVQSFTESQKLRETEKLLAARTELRRCAEPACPELTRKPCAEWLKELEVLVPTVSIDVARSDGKAIAAVRVTLDDSLTLPEPSGAPVEVDPGAHRLKVEVAGFGPQEQSFEIAAGTHELPLRFRFGPAEAAAQTGDEARAPSAAAIVGWTGVALAAAGLVAGAVSGGVAMSNKSDLDDECAAGRCTQDDIDAGSLPAHVSTASFIVAGVGALVGIICLAVDASTEEPAAGGAAAQWLIGPGNLAWQVRFP